MTEHYKGGSASHAWRRARQLGTDTGKIVWPRTMPHNATLGEGFITVTKQVISVEDSPGVYGGTTTYRVIET